ncbi:alternative ribosome rescue aminoacyl-tRNA hydrolase ArfB [Chitinasiproducens palmae]|uniref:Ribosome-associated protein n=1 Tax=Chitinasiproducens palmae TaxID=1770053 RepID=A0A1H2PQN7_9BURK|nr:alternative ribosome rescue aminoacyl-tRNA hydrolase ArfB [Chitinasiproducens palmae]SDV49140.1 ribosome-associated protein [Chitinasiproducens palmae]
MSMPYSLAPDEYRVTAVRAQGAGGQNVNKVSSAIHLRFDIRASHLPEPVKFRLLALADRRIDREGILIIKAQTHRTQESNRADAIERVERLIESVWSAPEPRRPTRPSRSARRRRTDEKVQRGEIKRGRARVSAD